MAMPAQLTSSFPVYGIVLGTFHKRLVAESFAEGSANTCTDTSLVEILSR